MQTQDNIETCYQRGNRRTWRKTSPRPFKLKLIHQRMKLEYMNNKRPFKPSLPHILKPSKLLLPTDFAKPCLLLLSRSRNLAQLHPPNIWLFPMLPSSIETSLYTQNGCGKCLGYQPFKDLEMERQELRKTTMDYVEDCGYNNL